MIGGEARAVRRPAGGPPLRAAETAGRGGQDLTLDRYGYATHEVSNQPPPLADYDAFASDDTLRRIVSAFGRPDVRLDFSPKAGRSDVLRSASTP